jgi:Raf kinase inhibitor-like YbhB/YbcL family protein
MNLESPAFSNGSRIPTRHTCDGEDISPALLLDVIPPGTVTLALVMDDPDAPRGTWDHWVAFDIVPTIEIPEGVGPLGTSGGNSWDQLGYGGPCPPSGNHHYYFKVFAVDARLGLAEGTGKAALLQALEGHVIAEATLLGRYSR